MMPQRRQMIAPQGLDITPMSPAPPMQFAAPQVNPDEGYNSLMGQIQKLRAGDDEEGGGSMRNQQVDSPLLRKKLPYADMAGAAQYANA